MPLPSPQRARKSLSQSTVSLHIKQLENEFGCALFTRSRKRGVVSEAGRALLPYVDRIFNEMKNAALAVRELSNSRRGTFASVSATLTLIYLLPKVLSGYRRKFPLIDVIVTTAVTEALLQGLHDQTIDLAIVMSPSDGLKSVEALPLMQEELVIVLASEHPLATLHAERREISDAERFFDQSQDCYRGVSPFPLALLYFRRGLMWLEDGELRHARTWFETAIRLLPAYSAAQGHLAEVEAASGELDAAIGRLLPLTVVPIWALPRT